MIHELPSLKWIWNQEIPFKRKALLSGMGTWLQLLKCLGTLWGRGNNKFRGFFLGGGEPQKSPKFGLGTREEILGIVPKLQQTIMKSWYSGVLQFCKIGWAKPKFLTNNRKTEFSNFVVPHKIARLWYFMDYTIFLFQNIVCINFNPACLIHP